MKVLFIVSSLSRGGPTRVLLDLASKLKEKDVRIQVLTISSDVPNSAKIDFLNYGIDVLSLNMNRLSFFVRGKITIKKVLSQLKPDIIHSMGVRSDYIISTLKNYCSIQVSTIHCFAIEEYKYVYGNLVGTYLAKKQINAMNKMKMPICCSFSIKEKYENTVSIKNNLLRTIQNGINVEKYAFRNEMAQKRKALHLPANKEIFVFVGRLTPHKNPILVIESFLKAQRPNSLLLIIGDGVLYKNCLEKQTDSVLVLGKTQNVNDYLESADFYISASLTEGLPLSVIEAGVNGKTLLLSSIPQHLEIVPTSFPGVQYFNPNNFNELERSIISVKKQNEKKISLYFISRFSSDRMAEEYYESYCELIGETTKK